MINLKSVKTQLLLFLVVFVLYLAVLDKSIWFFPPFLLTTASAVILETLLIFLKTKKWRITESSLLTGFIVGFVISDHQPWLVHAAASCFAIGSKHIIRFKGRHIFNPAAFGIVAAILFFGATTQWKGTYQWYILLPAGLYFVYRIRKMELLAAYAVTAMGIFSVQAALRGAPLVNIFWYLSYFFIFIMLIEPKTTPHTRIGKMVFGAGVAVIIVIFIEAGIKVDAELGALLLANITTPFLNKIKVKLSPTEIGGLKPRGTK